MKPEADPKHLSRQVWQAVSEHALRAIATKEFCPEQSRIENLRPTYTLDESEYQFGKQLWCFEAIGITLSGRRQLVYGSMELSVQYGLLEAHQAALFEEPAERDRWIVHLTSPRIEETPSIATRFWVWAAWASVIILTAGWMTALVRYAFSTTGNLAW